MAYFLMGSCKAFLFLTSFSFFYFLSVLSVEFQVGGDKGWAVPSSKDNQIFNEWASKNRFKVGDTLRFEYKKDSVLVVTNEDYEKCRSIHPIFFSNNGDSVFKLDRSGLFYYISGVSGHCERGLKMIIKVLELEIQSPSQNTTTDSTQKSGGVDIAKKIASPPIMLLMIISFLGPLFV